MRRRLLVSCEHGGNRVPAAYTPLFADAAGVLATHRGYDLGAVEVARAFGRRLGVTPFAAATTRLVVDLNRSPGNRNVFSAYTRSLSAEERCAARSAIATWAFSTIPARRARCASSRRGTPRSRPRRPSSRCGATIHIAARHDARGCC